ncbi:MAG: Two-component system sensor histidine kinase [uncultured Solirubrobacteraceae bacterium]|uniref:Two-component system sensor histidine kinase n=1 Tax=uncultured Solirubrobacteraceae bacterium TaxID=1162706 RepID=A0A6J4RGM3_9ACTN|nr:MAG: Two-component system sensor histidine kinase [uncultured Solirubrobacteraceae bacterium]
MATAAPTRPVLRRDPVHGVVAGVCAGLSERLGINPLALRVCFIAGAVLGGLGAVLYGLLWLVVPAGPGEAPHSRRAGAQLAAGVGLLVLAGLLSLRELGLWFSDAIVWPTVLAATGGALLWRLQRQGEQRPAPATGAGAPAAEAPSRADVAAGVYNGGFGIALVLGAILLFLQSNGALGPLRDVVLAVVVIGLGLGLILAPFLWRLGRNLAEERSARIRSQERAEVAAHLHDSVLQTLALVQKRADDPRAVATLARQQERELRAWLWDPQAPAADAGLAAALRAAAAEVEEAHGVPIEVVTVGDVAMADGPATVLAAAREALTNAAKFAGDAGPVALYAEAAPERVQVFVRDRGPGFDLAAVPADRRGVRDSIIGRMERHGGRAAIAPAPGGGTEVELVLEEAA